MADRSLRGMRLGAQSLQSEEGVTFSPRVPHTYRCETCGRETVMIFSAEAEAPDEWECKYCARTATRLVDSLPVIVDHSDEKIALSVFYEHATTGITGTGAGAGFAVEQQEIVERLTAVRLTFHGAPDVRLSKAFGPCAQSDVAEAD